MTRRYTTPTIDLDPWGETLLGTVNNLDRRITDMAISAWDQGRAVGDGTTDDTAAIQAALDACNEAGGGTVLLGAGTFKLTSALKFYSGATPNIVAYSNVRLKGAGADATILQQTTVGADVIKGLNDAANGAQAVNNTIEDLRLTFDGTATDSGNGLYLAQQSADGPAFQQWQIRNVVADSLQGSGKYGFNVESLITSTFQDCMAVSCANGFCLNGAVDGNYSSVSTSVTYINCYANLATNGVTGFRCTDNTYVTYVGCAADFSASSTGSAYLVEGSNAVGYFGCGCELDGTHTLSQMWKIAADADSNSSSQVALYNCYGFQGNSTIDVYVTGGSTGVTLIGFQDNSAVSGGTGLKIDAAAQATEIDCSWGGVATLRTLANTATWRTPGIPRVTVGTGSGTITPRAGWQDVVRYTAVNGAVTLAAPTGTPVDGQQLVIELTDNGTGRAITHNSIYVAGPTALATTTTASTRLREVFEYDATQSKWARVA